MIRSLLEWDDNYLRRKYHGRRGPNAASILRCSGRESLVVTRLIVTHCNHKSGRQKDIHSFSFPTPGYSNYVSTYFESAAKEHNKIFNFQHKRRIRTIGLQIELEVYSISNRN